MRRLILATAAVITSATALAGPSWTAEPTDVLGVPLGAPLPHIGQCPFASPCLVGPRSAGDFADAALRNLQLQSVGPAAWGMIQMYRGNVATFSVIAPHGSYRQLRALMVERYGEPSATRELHLTTALGVPLTGERADWTGVHVTLTLNEYCESVSRSCARFTDTDVTKEAGAALDAATASDASRF